MKTDRKYFIMTVDILTVFLILLHIHAFILLIINDFSKLSFHSFYDIIQYHRHYGIFAIFSETAYILPQEVNSSYMFLYFSGSAIIGLLNIPVFIYKKKAIKKKEEIFLRKYKYTCIINLIFAIYAIYEHMSDFFFYCSL